jgi:hypothetical protein
VDPLAYEEACRKHSARQVLRARRLDATDWLQLNTDARMILIVGAGGGKLADKVSCQNYNEDVDLAIGLLRHRIASSEKN